MRVVHQVSRAARNHLLPLLPDFDWGICHGDVSLDNVHMMPGGQITLYDFDLSCYGWRTWDVCNALGYASAEHQDAFLQGYRSVRPFSANELAAVPYFVVVDVIRMMADELGRWTDWFGSARVETWINDRRAWLRARQHDHAT